LINTWRRRRGRLTNPLPLNNLYIQGVENEAGQGEAMRRWGREVVVGGPWGRGKARVASRVRIVT